MRSGNGTDVKELDLLELARTVMVTSVTVSMPILIVISIVGLVISVLQALTQVQEQSLSFVPKLLAGVLTLFVLSPWIMGQLGTLFANLLKAVMV